MATGIRSFLLKIFWLNPAAAEKKEKSVLRIRDVYTGSRIQGQKDPGSASKHF
jgi:hypothetical protein